jgi:hypothetical protein
MVNKYSNDLHLNLAGAESNSVVFESGNKKIAEPQLNICDIGILASQKVAICRKQGAISYAITKQIKT